MRLALLLSVFFAGCVARDAAGSEQQIQVATEGNLSPAPSIESQLAELLEVDGTDPLFQRFELIPIPGAVTRFAAICDWEEMWWGCACTFEVTDGRVARLQVLDHTEHVTYRMRCIAFESVADPLLECFGKTHMGHGSYYLYRLGQDGADLLIKTEAVDYHHDLDLLRGGMLRPEYRDFNGDGATDVELSGTRYFNQYDDFEEEDYDGWRFQESVRKRFLYDPVARSFREDASFRIGSRYHE
ncbi:MAG: hypothetical protein IT464_10195 [Planctomycetes bacterium]|nr:hypothetical protein [Planctomycetota bacterium]